MKEQEDSSRNLLPKELARVQEIVNSNPMTVIMYSENQYMMGKVLHPSLTQDDLDKYYELQDLERWRRIYKALYTALKVYFNEHPEFAVRFIAFKGFIPRPGEDRNTIAIMARACLKGHHLR
jgi:hypothetical protein